MPRKKAEVVEVSSSDELKKYKAAAKKKGVSASLLKEAKTVKDVKLLVKALDKEAKAKAVAKDVEVVEKASGEVVVIISPKKKSTKSKAAKEVKEKKKRGATKKVESGYFADQSERSAKKQCKEIVPACIQDGFISISKLKKALAEIKGGKNEGSFVVKRKAGTKKPSPPKLTAKGEPRKVRAAPSAATTEKMKKGLAKYRAFMDKHVDANASDADKKKQRATARLEWRAAHPKKVAEKKK